MIEHSMRGVASAIYTTYALAAPGANTNFVNGSTGFKVSPVCGMARITICLTTGSVLNLHVTDGATAYVNGINSSTALNAGDVYVFELPLRYTSNGDDAGTVLTYNLQLETDSVIRFCFIDLISGPNT